MLCASEQEVDKREDVYHTDIKIYSSKTNVAKCLTNTDVFEHLSSPLLIFLKLE
jgi:hypothetical protein